MQEEKIWREADPRRLQEEERGLQEEISQEECPSYRGKEELEKSGELDSIHKEEKDLAVLREEPQIDQQRPSLERTEGETMTSMEDISRRTMVEEEERAMVEEDSSRRGSLLDELREEEEMRLRLLQVETLSPSI